MKKKNISTFCILICIIAAVFCSIGSIFISSFASTTEVKAESAEAAPSTLAELRNSDPNEVAKLSKFDGRDYGIITPVKDQGSSNICWAYATVNASEASILRKGIDPFATKDSLSLSPEALAYRRHNRDADPLGNTNRLLTENYGSWNTVSGDPSYGADVFSQWCGPIAKSQAVTCDPYENTEYRMENAMFIDYDTVTDTKIAAIKRAVASYGAVTYSYNNYRETEYYNPKNETSGSSYPHACTIIGWDDTIPASKFIPNGASRDGGWLVKNSYNSLPYFYLSYDNNSSTVYAFDYAAKSDYDFNYFYDNEKNNALTPSNYITKAANVFAAKKGENGKDEQLRSVNIGFQGKDVTCTVKVYIDLIDSTNPESGTLAAVENCSFDYSGFRTVKLKTPVKLEKGTSFSVVAEVSNSRENAHIHWAQQTSPLAKSYKLASGGYWTKSQYPIRIKAFTKLTDANEQPEPPDITDTYERGEVPRIYFTTPDGNGNNLKKWIYDENGKEIEVGYTLGVKVAVIAGNGEAYADIIDSAGAVKVRGNSTAVLDKKPYNFKLSSKQSVLGMNNAKTWVLLANRLDPTLLRNYVAFDFGAEIGLEYTPKQRIVEVYMDGRFLGTYTLMEKIDKLVDIDTTAGEFLLELDGRTEDGVTYVNTQINGENHKFAVSNPEMPSSEQLNNINYVLNEVNAAMASGDYRKICKVVDVESFAKYYIVNEFVKTLDIKSGSVYFYYKNGKLYAGPMWDYDLSQGNAGKIFKEYFSNGNSYSDLYAAESCWFPELFKYRNFYDTVTEICEANKAYMQNTYAENGLVDMLTYKYKTVFERNFASTESGGAGWDINYKSDFMLAPEATLEKNIAVYKQWLNSRADYMTNSLSDALLEKVKYPKQSLTYTDLNDCNIELSGNTFVYGGNALTPNVTVTCGGVTLVKDTDYTVSYDNNVNAGTAKVTVTGKGDYIGSANKFFTIVKADGTATVTINGWTYGDTLNTPVYRSDTNTGTPAIEYAVRGSNSFSTAVPTNAGNYTVRITYPETSNYNAVVATCDFTINKAMKPSNIPQDFTTDQTKVSALPPLSNGWSYKEPTATLSVGANIVTVIYSDNTNYEQTEFDITVTVMERLPEKIEINECNVTLSESSFVYTGNANKPSVVVKYGNVALLENTDYTVEYTNNINAGTATITITGMGNYIGSVNKTFMINKADGIATVKLGGWIYGNPANTPVSRSETNSGTPTVEYAKQYSNSFSTAVPVNAGNYIVRITYPETTNYTAAVATYNFTISKADCSGEIKTEDFTYNEDTFTEPELPAGITAKYICYLGEEIIAEESSLSAVITKLTAGVYNIRAVYSVNDNYEQINDRTFTITVKSRATPTEDDNSVILIVAGIICAVVVAIGVSVGVVYFIKKKKK